MLGRLVGLAGEATLNTLPNILLCTIKSKCTLTLVRLQTFLEGGIVHIQGALCGPVCKDESCVRQDNQIHGNLKPGICICVTV